MKNSLIAIWNSSHPTAGRTTVLPDGCRDLIMKIVGNERPQWFVSPLFDQAQPVRVAANSTLTGFRIRPGTSIRTEQLLSHVQQNHLQPDEAEAFLQNFLTIEAPVAEALQCLEGEVKSIRQAAADLGVSIRTLQRLILSNTGRPPGYWLQLARVRKAARSLLTCSSYSDVAARYGFTDQSHMNREFQRWFKVTPSEWLNTPQLISQLHEKAYA